MKILKCAKSKARVVLLVAFLALTACGGSSSSVSTKQGGSYNVLVLSALSGALASYGNAEAGAFRATAAYINAHGGIGGRTVNLDIQDDLGTATDAARVVQTALASGTKYDLVIPGTFPNDSAAVVPLVAAHKILSIAPSSIDVVNLPDKYPYSFSTSVTSRAVSIAAVQYAKERGFKKAALLTTNDAGGIAHVAPFTAALAKTGIDAVVASFDPKSLDITPQLLQLQAGKPDVLLVSAAGPAAATVLRNRTKLGWNVPVVGDTTVAVAGLAATVSAPDLHGVVVACLKIMVAGDTSSAYQTFAAEMAKQGDMKVVILSYSGPWDALMLAKSGVEQANSVDASAVAKALTGQKRSASPYFVQSKYIFTTTDHTPTFSYGDFTFAKPGPIVNGIIQTGQ